MIPDPPNQAERGPADPLPPVQLLADGPSFPTGFWLIMATLFVGLIGAFALQSIEASTFVLLMVLAFPVGWAARSVPGSLDRSWLPNLIMAGWVAKLVASSGRYWALQVLYNGVGDATGYHNHGVRYAPIWRSLQLPPLGTGTDFVEAGDRLSLHSVTSPRSSVASSFSPPLRSLGQVLYLRSVPQGPSPFRPEVVRSSGLLLPEHRLLAFEHRQGVTHDPLHRSRHLRSGATCSRTTDTMGGRPGHRSHWGRTHPLPHRPASRHCRWRPQCSSDAKPSLEAARLRRLVSLVGIAVVLVAAVSYAIQDFGVDLSAGVSASLVEDELDPIFAGVEDQTDKGGSAVEGTAIRSPLDVPRSGPPRGVPTAPDRRPQHPGVGQQHRRGLVPSGAVHLADTRHHSRTSERRWREPYVMFALIYTPASSSVTARSSIWASWPDSALSSIPFVLVLLVALGAGTASNPSQQCPSRMGEPGTSFDRAHAR